MSYFTAVLARDGRARGRSHDVDVDSRGDLGELTDELRAVADDDEPVLLLRRARGRLVGGRAGRRRGGPAGLRVRRRRARPRRPYAELLDARDGDEEDDAASRAPAAATSTCWPTSARRPRR